MSVKIPFLDHPDQASPSVVVGDISAEPFAGHFRMPLSLFGRRSIFYAIGIFLAAIIGIVIFTQQHSTTVHTAKGLSSKPGSITTTSQNLKSGTGTTKTSVANSQTKSSAKNNAVSASKSAQKSVNNSPTSGGGAGASPPSSSITCNIVASPGAGTAQTAIDAAKAGQTICLHGGTYTQPTASSSDTLNFSRGGSAGAPITITSYPGEKATLQNTNGTSASNDVVSMSDSINYVTFDNVNFIGPPLGFVFHTSSDYLTVTNADITDNGGSGGNAGKSCVLLGSPTAGPSQYNNFSHDTVHDCGRVADGNQDHCFYVDDTLNSIFSFDVIYDCVGYSIQLYPQSMGSTVDHVTIDGGPYTVRGGIVVGGDTGFPQVSSNNTISNSILTGAVTDEINGSAIAGTNNVVNDNCMWPGSGGGDFDNSAGFIYTNNSHSNPLFVNSSAHNYSLSSGSPCGGRGAF